jgi:hypothetical protein
MTGDPFRELGLSADPDLTGDDIRAAWRRVAASTHPDRADGGDPAAFAAAAAAYNDLRTLFGRREALADLTSAASASGPTRVAGFTRRGPGRLAGAATRWAARVRLGRPARLAVRVLAAGAFSVLVVTVAGWRPASAALLVGALSWLIRGGRRDLAVGRPPAASFVRPAPPGGGKPR